LRFGFQFYDYQQNRQVNADFPHHFGTMIISPSHSPLIPPTPSPPRYDVNIHAISIYHNVLLVLQQPTTQFDLPTHIACGDKAIFNSNRFDMYEVVGIYEIAPQSNDMTYVFYSMDDNREMYVKMPKEWSSEADW
jgi:hypothetical protein